jgi:diadenylate cyclase
MHFIANAGVLGAETATIITNFQDPAFIAQFIISLLILLAVTLFVSIKIHRAFVRFFYIILDIIFALSLIFGMTILALVAAFFIAVGTCVFLIVNAGVIRNYVSKPLQLNKGSTKDNFNKEKLITDVCTTVQRLSDQKIGALITFERKISMDNFIISGTIINCPFTPEIVETIFFEGTRLHDGAIIIRGNVIVAAAVYYPPSTKPMIGKVGARHRAALGISEITDSVTIVVSEETGRISIAHDGLLDNVKNDEFPTVFRNRII